MPPRRLLLQQSRAYKSAARTGTEKAQAEEFRAREEASKLAAAVQAAEVLQRDAAATVREAAATALEAANYEAILLRRKLDLAMEKVERIPRPFPVSHTADEWAAQSREAARTAAWRECACLKELLHAVARARLPRR
eukprot:798691-Pleurochrysis_carterae.AAC.4